MVRLPRVLMLALMLTTGVVAVMAYSQAGASVPAVGAVVATDDALLALACADDVEAAGGADADPICRVEGGRLVLDFTRYENPASPAPTYTLDDVTFGAERLTEPVGGWYVYVEEVVQTGAQTYSGPVGQSAGVPHTVSVKPETAQQVTVGGNPNCFSIDWEQPSHSDHGTATICLDPSDGGDTVYGFQPGSEYVLEDLFTVTNNSNGDYTITMTIAGDLENPHLDVSLSAGSVEFYPSGDSVTLAPGDSIDVTVSFKVDEDWPDGTATINGRIEVHSEVIEGP